MPDTPSDSFVEIAPLSHRRFGARWALSREASGKGERASSPSGGKAELVLRVFFMGAGSESDSHSKDWCDYSIDASSGQKEFDLPKSPLRINAALGFVGQSKRFSPLVGASAVDLPALPEHDHGASVNSEEKQVSKASDQPLSDAEIAARLAKFTNLPDELKAAPRESDEEASSEERLILDTVLRQLAADPYPAELKAKAAAADLASTARFAPRSGSSEPNEASANPWQTLWSGRAPIEIKAEFILYGKIAEGLRLMLGQTIIEPDAEGAFTWRKKLEAFDQVWPLLRIALEAPTVQAGPSLEFFKEMRAESRLLEIHGKLQLFGHISDPAYIPLLPDQIRIREDGQFSLSRLLPDGAIILPGLSLVAE